MKIIKLYFHLLRNEPHLAFFSFFNDLLGKYTAVAEKLTAFMSKFQQWLATEEQVVDQMRKSNYTELIQNADHRLDKDIVGFSNAIESAMRHFDPEVVASAKKLHNLLHNFGRITHKSYEAELVATGTLLAQLRGDYAADVTKLALAPWVEEIGAAFADFKSLMEARITEQSVKPKERVKEVRREIESVYHDMTGMVEALARTEGDEAYSAFADELNVAVERLNNETHRTQKDIKNANVEGIPNQSYTGKAITPIPTVFYAAADGAKQLTFAVDFTLTYKNNINVGTATLILHGKGAYKGQKEITFNIS
jgi:hypothetical protein